MHLLKCNCEYFIILPTVTAFFHLYPNANTVGSDYNGSKQIVNVISLNSGVKERAFYNSFLRVVEVEGWGKALQGDCVGFLTTNNTQWHSSPYPVDSKDQAIQQGTVAVDPTISICRG